MSSKGLNINTILSAKVEAQTVERVGASRLFSASMDMSKDVKVAARVKTLDACLKDVLERVNNGETARDELLIRVYESIGRRLKKVDDAADAFGGEHRCMRCHCGIVDDAYLADFDDGSTVMQCDRCHSWYHKHCAELVGASRCVQCTREPRDDVQLENTVATVMEVRSILEASKPTTVVRCWPHDEEPSPTSTSDGPREVGRDYARRLSMNGIRSSKWEAMLKRLRNAQRPCAVVAALAAAKSLAQSHSAWCNVLARDEEMKKNGIRHCMAAHSLTRHAEDANEEQWWMWSERGQPDSLRRHDKRLFVLIGKCSCAVPVSAMAGNAHACAAGAEHNMNASRQESTRMLRLMTNDMPLYEYQLAETAGGSSRKRLVCTNIPIEKLKAPERRCDCGVHRTESGGSRIPSCSPECASSMWSVLKMPLTWRILHVDDRTFAGCITVNAGANLSR